MRRLLLRCSSAILFWAPVRVLAESVFDGPGLKDGVNEAIGIEGPAHGTFRESVAKMLGYVLNLVALAAVVAIVAAGLYLILGMGTDESKTKAKNIMLYTVIGLALIVLARVIVGLYINEIQNIFN